MVKLLQKQRDERHKIIAKTLNYTKLVIYATFHYLIHFHKKAINQSETCKKIYRELFTSTTTFERHQNRQYEHRKVTNV